MMRQIALYVIDEERQSIAQPVTMEPMDDAIPHQPTVSMRPENAQVLMDDLWRAGLRPTDGAGTAGSMRAVENHLKDMRKIAFNKLKISD